jgi:hypothetical protein
MLINLFTGKSRPVWLWLMLWLVLWLVLLVRLCMRLGRLSCRCGSD